LPDHPLREDRRNMPEARNAREVGARIEALLGDLDSIGDAPTRAKTEELIGLVVELYGAGLERIMELAYEGGPAGEELLKRLIDDELIESLLILHGLHPVEVETRVHNALEKVRPYLGSHAGGVEFLGVDEAGVAHLRLEGNCDGCPSSTVTVKTAIEGAIAEAAPEITRVEVEGVTEPSAPHPSLIQIEPLAGAVESSADQTRGGLGRTADQTRGGLGRTADQTRGGLGRTADQMEMPAWTQLPESVAPQPGQTAVLERAGVSFLLCSVGGDLYAYRNACSACAAPLDRAGLEEGILVCGSCRHRYDVRLAGRSLDNSGLHLHPLPLIREDGRWAVSLGRGVLQ
jgi:Fe-S cluster biogenesis protein NfuA/nitrite reductase/ring-hydroxylating ferredoxin subunit